MLVVSAAEDAPPAYRDAEPRSRFVPLLHRVDEHLPGLLVIERHAFWPLLFADPAQQPLVVRPPYAAIAAPLREPPPARLLETDRPVAAAAPYLDNWPANFDYVLVLDAGAIAAKPLRPDRLEPREATDFAALYRVNSSAR